jgi:hypothetical protein
MNYRPGALTNYLHDRPTNYKRNLETNHVNVNTFIYGRYSIRRSIGDTEPFFYFGVLHPVARTLLKLLEERPLVTIFKVFIYVYFAATCFGPRWPSSGNFPKIIVYSA